MTMIQSGNINGDQATLNVAMYHLDPKGRPYMHTTVFRNQSVDEDILVSENEANNANRDTDRSYRFVHATSYPKLPSPQMTRHVSSTLGATVPARIDENDIPTDFLKSIRPYLLREKAKIDWYATKAIPFSRGKMCAAAFPRLNRDTIIQSITVFGHLFDRAA